eukprot:SM000007S20848  [mRNA]  locus=s7:521683:523212:- [translate_table: standard]
MKFLDIGVSVATVTLGVNRKKGPADETDWYNIELWDKLAEIANDHVRKGDKVYVSGRVKIDKFLSKEGQPRTALKVVAQTLNFVEAYQGRAELPDSSRSYASNTDTERLTGAAATGRASTSYAPQTSAASQTHGAETLWERYFVDPSKWWDNRFSKTNPKSPDFKHKETGEALWIDSRQTPPWVAGQLSRGTDLLDAAMTEDSPAAWVDELDSARAGRDREQQWQHQQPGAQRTKTGTEEAPRGRRNQGQMTVRDIAF